MARKRGSVHELKTALQEVESASLGGGPGGNEAGEAGRERIERLRAQLSLDTTLYKGAVQTLRELKAEIEGLQEELKQSQAVLQADFQRWHGPALAEAKARLAGRGGGGGGGRGDGGGGAGGGRRPGSTGGGEEHGCDPMAGAFIARGHGAPMRGDGMALTEVH